MTAAGMGSYQWRFDSGRICLDLVATAPESDRHADGPEPFADPEGLAHWLAAAGLVPADTRPAPVDGTWVAGFVELRDCVDRLVRGGRQDARAEHALAILNARAQGAPPGIRAVRDEDGGLVRALCSTPECSALLAVVARDAVDLLTDPVARSRLRQCEGDNCRRVYLDTSRGRRRRWCSSEVCGNRERVARHRRKASVKDLEVSSAGVE
ncbi:CGNR zinc finger domain-containing protein [Streptomyces sp. NPDC096176]|uniref:CGNR zinc finger domain-containing protein n=1 Tax=Streptomyces sp. NPDC096176 TaxID=3366079 RepID=UPI00380C766D